MGEISLTLEYPIVYESLNLEDTCETRYFTTLYADVAQLGEQLTCNQQVAGSIPVISSTNNCQPLVYMRGCIV